MLPGEEVNLSSLQNRAYFVQHGIMKIWLHEHNSKQPCTRQKYCFRLATPFPTFNTHAL